MISAVVLTRNEARHLPDCLATLHWADEILVLDSGSSDTTVQIAAQAGARVVQRAFTHFGDQREAALRLARHPWVLFVDADERIPLPLADEIRYFATDDWRESGWWIARRNYFWGREVRYSGWAPDHQLRLIRVSHTHYDTTQHVHEVATVDGEIGYLNEPLIHINYDSWGEFWAKQRQYAHYETSKLRANGIAWKPHSVILQPLRAFYRRFIALHGWRDGLLGLQLAAAMAWWEGVAYWGLRG